MHEQLEEYLDALARDDCYRVDAVLKENPHETTERVYFVGSNGAETGPFIRKRLDPEAGIGSAYERLWKAQRAGRRFQHLPHLIDCYSTGEASVVVMEHVNGETLADLVWRLDASEELALRIFDPICEAVQELHERFDPPMIHRDLKPSNIMLNEGGVTIIDLGIAREYDSAALADTHRFGTRSYAPPEQFGYGQTDERSDVYALGMILFYCLTEKTPEGPATCKSFDQPKVPAALRPILAKATAFDPAARYATVRELRSAFQEATGRALSRIQSQGVSAMNPVAAALPTATPELTGELLPRADEREQLASRFRFTIPRGVGIAWNVVLLVTWAIFAAAGISMVVDPPESMLAYAPWGRVVLSFGIVGVSFGLVGVALMDKRRLIARFPALGRQNPLARFFILIALAFLVLVITAIIALPSMPS